MTFFLRVFIIGFFVGIILATFIIPQVRPIPSCFSGQRQGIVDDFPEESETYQRFLIRVGKQRLFVYAPLYPTFSYGDLLKLEIRERSECGSPIMFPKITLMAKNQGEFLKTYLFEFRKIFTEHIERIFHEPRASLAASILLGRHGKNEHDEAFRKAGLSHITALSGFNITILILFVAALFAGLNRPFRFYASLLIIILFVLLTGASASTVRAAIMGLSGLYAKYIGRSQTPLHSLLLAGFFMVLFQPLILVEDIGFQLSFLATLGMILFSSRLNRFVEHFSMPSFIREIITATLAAQIFTTPLIIFTFGTFNPMSLFANLLVLPSIPFIMGVTFVATSLHFATESGAMLVGFYADLLLSWMILVARIFARFVLYTR